MGGAFITGLGVASPAGSTVPQFWARISCEQAWPTRLDDEFVSARHMENRLFYRTELPALGPTDQAESAAARLAEQAIREALADAGLDAGRQCVGLVVGTGAGEIDRFERTCFTVCDAQMDGAYVLAARLARRLGLGGPNLTVSTACSASAYGFLCAEDMLETVELDAVVVCGVEAPSRTTLASFNRLLALDGERCRPFAAERGGTVLGDGAAAVVLQRDAAECYAKLRGIGVSCDAYHPTAPRPGGDMIAAALNQALERAAIGPEQIDLIVPHGTGTLSNDREEYQLLRRVLGERLGSVPVFPLKGKIGHGGGAAGAFSVITLALMLRHKEVPPTTGWGPAPEFGLLIPKDRPLRIRARFGLINAYAFGGNNASLVLGAMS